MGHGTSLPAYQVIYHCMNCGYGRLEMHYSRSLHYLSSMHIHRQAHQKGHNTLIVIAPQSQGLPVNMLWPSNILLYNL